MGRTWIRSKRSGAEGGYGEGLGALESVVSVKKQLEVKREGPCEWEAGGKQIRPALSARSKSESGSDMDKEVLSLPWRRPGDCCQSPV